MNDQEPTKELLVEELVEMRKKFAKLKAQENIHKQILKKLRDSEEKYSTIVENVNDGIAIAQNGKVKFVNSKLLELFGFSLEETLEKSFIDFIAPEYRKEIMEQYKKRIAREQIPNRYEIELCTKDGRKIPVEINSSLIDYKGKPADLAIVRDISERKTVEKALRDSEARYRGLYDSSMDGIVSSDIEGNIVGCNQAYADMHNYTKAELLKMSIWDLIHDRWRDKAIKIRSKQMLIRGYSDEFELEHVKKDGTIFPVSGRAWQRKDKDGNILGGWGIIRDITERKKLESQLIESENKYRTLIDQSLQGIAIIQDKSIVFANPAFADISGYTINELLAFTLVEANLFLHPEDRELVLERIRDRLMGKQVPPRHDFRIIRKDGSIRWLDASVSLIEYRGKPAVQGTFVDITKRKQAEEEMKEYAENLEKLVEERTNALKTSEMQLRAILTGIGDSITIQNKNLDIIWTNQRIIDIYGNVSGKKCYEVYHQLTEKCPNCTVQTVFEKEETLTSESSIIRSNGEYVPILVTSSPIRDDEGNIFAVIEVTKDIRELKKMEKQLKEYAEELKESEERYRGLYESSIDGIAFTNMEAKIVDCNQAFADMLGYTKEELYQLTLWDITPSKWLNMNKKIFTNQVYVKGYSDEYEKEYIKKDGTFIPVSARAWVIKDKEGTPTGSWGIICDITERKKIDQMKSKFINVAAHELRTPLSALKAHIDLLKIKIDRGFWLLPEEVKKKINIIARNADRLALLINNLLDYTRLEAGTLKMSSELSSLENLAIETVRDVNLLAKKHKHEITIITPHSLPLMYLDKEKINAIFNNLLSNAIKYTPEGGTINVMLTELDDNIHIMVKDNGIGIADDDLERIFLPFYVADLNITDRLQIQPEFERTGLGLAITKEYVKMHGGSIWVESQVGKGSTFHIILPKRRKD